jgi:glycosyltransferase involved in cell wall biosynthesis
VRRLLVIAYMFPPVGGAGVQRTAGFVRHLPGRGWSPSVLAGRPHGYWGYDPTLLQGIEVEVERVASWGETIRRWGRRAARGPVRRWYDEAFVPDAMRPWRRPAVQAALRMHAGRRFAAIYSTGGPWTDHLVALDVVRRTGLPWVADFRDPWTYSALRPPAAWARPLHHRLEARVLDRADVVVANTPGQADLLRERFAVRGRLVVIPNGYEEDDFDQRAEPEPGLSLGYAGAFYGDYQPTALFERLAGLGAEAPRIHVVGNVGEGRGWPPGLSVTRHGPCSNRAALRRLDRCTGLFAVLPDRPGTGCIVPQKIYPYLRLGKPVLWAGPDGDAWRLLERSGGRHLRVDLRSPATESLRAWLATLGPTTANDPAFVRRFDRSRLTARLAEELDALVDRGPPRPAEPADGPEPSAGPPEG